jgi:exodeoxyribonuclease VII large subunit
LKGQVSLYAPRGDYQLIVSSMQPAGAGNLMQQFEELKKKLDAEGLFAQEIKKQIPAQPKHIGVITSESTAAFQDILTTIQRRAPISQLSLISATVQGDTAPKTLIEALQSVLNYNNLNPANSFDVILICRGGGSIEDLWAFNNESLAREIFDFPLPIISGVGHEIDFTITDFVADLRAPTPTAAAELVTQYYFQLNDRLEEWRANLSYLIQARLTKKSQAILFASKNLKSPLTMLKEQSQSLDNVEIRLANIVQNIMSGAKQSFQLTAAQIYQSSAIQRFGKYEDRLVSTLNSLNSQIKNLIDRKKLMLSSVNSNLKAISPLAVLERGYAIVMNENGQALKSTEDLKVGDSITTRLADGRFSSNVSKKD